jgi:hypothetical protein
MPNPSPPNGRSRANSKVSSPTLGVDQSASLRDRLLGEVAGSENAEAATAWAKTALLDKNRLIAADAKLVEDAFEHRLAALLNHAAAEPKSADVEAAAPGHEPGDSTDQQLAPAANGRAKVPGKALGIDKSTLTISEPRRYRNKEHLRFVAARPCLICARKPSDPHHLRFAQPRALGRKVSDEYTVPLCRIHHRANHRAGDERAWWRQLGMDPLKIARDLWRETRGRSLP